MEIIEKISCGKIEIEYFGNFDVDSPTTTSIEHQAIFDFNLLRLPYLKKDYDFEKNFFYGIIFDPFDPFGNETKGFFYIKVAPEKIFCKILGDVSGREINEFKKYLNKIVEKWESE